MGVLYGARGLRMLEHGDSVVGTRKIGESVVVIAISRLEQGQLQPEDDSSDIRRQIRCVDRGERLGTVITS